MAQHNMPLKMIPILEMNIGAFTGQEQDLDALYVCVGGDSPPIPFDTGLEKMVAARLSDYGTIMMGVMLGNLLDSEPYRYLPITMS